LREPAAVAARERHPVCNAAEMATMPELPDGFHADAINKHFVDDQ
jgi:hypothetical protein